QRLDPTGVERLARLLEHRRALVEADEPRAGVRGKHAAGRLARPGAELEHASRVDAARRLGGPLLELVVARELRVHELEVVARREVELAHRPESDSRRDDEKGPRRALLEQNRRPPTLPGGCPPSTIG